MSDGPPPPFWSGASVDDTLSVPDLPDADRGSIASSQRRWDDPPEEDPGVQENFTTMVFIKGTSARQPGDAEILNLTFTPTDSHVTALVPKLVNIQVGGPQERNMSVWQVSDGARVTHAGMKVSSGFSFRPGNDLIVACPYFRTGEGGGNQSPAPRIEIFDLRKKNRIIKQDLAVRAPLAWHPSGGSFAGVSTKDPTRIVWVTYTREFLRIKLVIVGKHEDEVTQLAFTPDGRAIVSAARDGYVRVTALETGKTLHRIEIGSRIPCARIFQVSTTGKTVVSIWGRDVVHWRLDNGRVNNYNLNVVRQEEGWPLAVSPDCRYLLCRTEEGFDVSDVENGRFRGGFAVTSSIVTSAAFSHDGKKLVIGTYNGMVQIFDIVTV